MPPDTFGHRLSLARRWRQLSIKQAAARCGLNYGSWSEWERGAQPQNFPAVVAAIADGLDIDLTWLTFGGPLSRPSVGGPLAA